MTITVDVAVLVSIIVMIATIVASHVRLEQTGKLRHEANVLRFEGIETSLIKLQDGRVNDAALVLEVTEKASQRLEGVLSMMREDLREHDRRIANLEGRR